MLKKIFLAAMLVLLGTGVVIVHQKGLLPLASVTQDPMDKCYDESNPDFSWWGWCHKEMHDRGWVADLMEQTKPRNCCNGVESGECRITKVEMENGKVVRAFVDGKWVVPSYPPSIGIITELKPGYAIVCAGRYGGVYCVGISPGL